MTNFFKIASLFILSRSFGSRVTISMKRTSTKVTGLDYKPKNENQQRYVKCLNDVSNKLIFAVGPAGTGKTLFACSRAIQELKDGSINKLVITRPVVPVEEDLGFLPGNINKKMDPWMRPVFDLLSESFSHKEVEAMLYTGVIEISPLAYMRGRTFKNCFIIGDEMQNSSPNQMMMLVTRIGVGSRMVITGDLKQSDKNQNSGLADFIDKYKVYNPNEEKPKRDKIQIIEFEKGDVERSEIVSMILNIYEEPKKVDNIYAVVDEPEKKIPILEDIEVSLLKMINGIDKNNDAALIPAHHYKEL